MGNAVFKTLAERSKAENIATMKILLQMYESLKTGTSDGSKQHTLLSNPELYAELEKKLIAALGDAENPAREMSDADPLGDPYEATVLARAEGSNKAGMGMGMGVRRKKRSTDNVSILVVDDSHISCKLATRALGQHGFHCEVALNGQMGLDMLLIRPTDFDLVLLDIVMPGLDGIEVLNRMKGHPQLREVPVAILSGLEDRTLADVCLQQGAVAVLPKPMKMEGVLAVVRQQCRRPPPPAPISTVPADCPTRSSYGPLAETGGSTGWDLRVPRNGSHSSRFMRTGPWRRRDTVGLPARWGQVFPGEVVPNFELLDSKFRSYQLLESLAKHPDRKLLIAFFPAAISEAGAGHGPDRKVRQEATSVTSEGAGVLALLNENMEQIRATNTDVVGVGSDLPFTMATLSMHLGLHFHLLSDPFLHAGEAFVGTYDMSVTLTDKSDGETRAKRMSREGRRSGLESGVDATTTTTETAEAGDDSATEYRVPHAGVVVVDSARVCRYCWVANQHGEEGPLDIPRLITVLQQPPPAVTAADHSIGSTKEELPEPPPSPDNPVEEGSPTAAVAPPNGRAEGAAMGRIESWGSRGNDSAQEIESLRLREGDPILVVDDSTISSQLAMRKLRAMGHPTMHAENGETALALLRRDPSRIRLVLLDIVMPVMDGLQLLTLVKGDAALQHIPIVMLSGLEDEKLVAVCVESGAAGVLQKPLKTNELQNFLNHRKDGRPLSEGHLQQFSRAQAKGCSTSANVGRIDSSPAAL